MDVDGMDHRRHHFFSIFKFTFCSSFNFGERESIYWSNESAFDQIFLVFAFPFFFVIISTEKLAVVLEVFNNIKLPIAKELK